ncbi:MAG: NACHT domain-containing protein [Caldilineaceae bacterium]
MDHIEVGNLKGNTGVAIGSHITQIVNYYYRSPDDGDTTEMLAHELTIYLKWVQRRYGSVSLRGMQRPVELSLDSIYAPLSATVYTPTHGARAPYDAEEPEAVDGQHRIVTSTLLSLGKRIVVMGRPGSGKTTVLQFIAHTLATALLDNDVSFAQRLLGLDVAERAVELPIPFVFPLSIYAMARRANAQIGSQTLTAVIANYLIEQQQQTLHLLPGFFTRLLQSGRFLILLLDGLDEVPVESERIRVRQHIERLVDGRPNLRIVVTCRTTAYQGHSELGRDFCAARVEPLDGEHVARLVQNAYGKLYKSNPVLGRKQTQVVLRWH